jgi:hypothetical protein
MIHELKTWPGPFQATWNGLKLFEFRKNDRDFKVGDTLLLREYDPYIGYTGREIITKITYILSEGYDLPENYCILSIGHIMNKSRKKWVIKNEL